MERIDAMAVDGRSPKRAKRTRRVVADLPNSAAVEGGSAASGPFRCAIRSFISQYARIPAPSQQVLRHLRTWRIAFPVGAEEAIPGKGFDGGVAGDVVEVDVVEEDVEKSRKIYCDHCRIVGWSGHPVCTKRYHLMIRNENCAISTYRPHCKHCGALQQSSQLRCASCDHEITASELEDWALLQLEDPTHLLHGIVHANGYGHLLRINGREGGSKSLTGYELMEFWDRLCKLLHVRKVSVMDISKKHGMEYRVLHAVAYGHSWYGVWGYQFGAGSFSLTVEDYQEAIDDISSIPLSHFCSQRSPSPTQLENIIAFYTSLAGHKLRTVRDLFQSIMKLVKDGCGCGNAIDVELPVKCSWTEQDVRQTEDAIIKILRAVNGSRWINWCALRAATFKSVGSLELIDHCLKRIGGKEIDGSLIVAVRCNVETSSVECRVEPVSNKLLHARCGWRPPTEHVLRDLKFLYDALLNPVNMKPYRPQSTWELAQSSAAKLLDCKQFIKHYDRSKDVAASNPFALHIWCDVELVDRTEDFSTPPPELLVLPINATVEDLKIEATKAFQSTYLIFRRFKAEELVCHGNISDSTEIKSLLHSEESCQVRGRCFGVEGIFKPFLMERGTEDWIVDCICGAKDDDGERMLACDKCGIWQHTRCSGIKDINEVPANFICRFCRRNPKLRGRGRGSRNRTYKCKASGGNCQTSKSGKGEKRCFMAVG